MIREPVFIVGHSRSGTTLLQRCLERSDDLWVIGREGKPIWESLFHPMLRGWSSNAVDAGEATPEVVAKLHGMFTAACVRPTLAWDQEGILAFLDWVRSHGVNPYWYGQDLEMVRARFPGEEPSGPPANLETDPTAEIPPFTLPPLAARRPGADDLRVGLRMLEKSIQNPFRIPFVQAVFPDARFVFVLRDGRECISSNISAWRDPHSYFSYKVPVELDIPGYSDVHPWGRRWWNLALPPGWRDLTTLPLEEVCAHAWMRATRAMLEHVPALTARGAVMVVHYRELVSEPTPTLARIAEFIGIPATGRVTSPIFPPVPGGTRPEKSKWRRDNAREIGRILPLIADLQSELGYPDTLEG